MKIRKRLLAILLCLCMLAGYLPAQTVKAQENEGVLDTSTYYLNDEKTLVYTSSNFSTEEKYNSALGAYASSSYAIPWTENVLVNSSTKNAIFSGLQKEYLNNK